jgi:hypothetical protein
MANVQTSGVDAILAPVNVGLLRVKFGNYSQYTIHVSQFCNNGSHYWTNYLTTW